MLSSKGDQEDALNHLNSDSLQQYLDRLWEQENNSLQGEDRVEAESEALELSNVQDTCMSVTNSVLKHGQFQEMVRNKDISSDVSFQSRCTCYFPYMSNFILKSQSLWLICSHYYVIPSML